MESAFLERSWVDLKQNPYLYGLNKSLSIILSIVLAFITIFIRASVVKKNEVPCESEDYKFIFWMLFVFYSFQALGELYEFFLQLNGSSEKGLIGLLFEINYFCGLYVTFRVVQAVFRSPQCVVTSPVMYTWLTYQTILFFACCVVTLMFAFCQWKIQRRVTKRRRRQAL